MAAVRILIGPVSNTMPMARIGPASLPNGVLPEVLWLYGNMNRVTGMVAAGNQKKTRGTSAVFNVVNIAMGFSSTFLEF